jgi:RHS repeat-associated protein
MIPTRVAYYVYDEAGRLLGEYDATGKAVYETVYLDEQPVAVLTQPELGKNSVYYAYADHLNSVRVIVRPSDQAFVWLWGSGEPFGQVPPGTNPSNLGVFTYNPRMPGQVADVESGWFYNWHRDYNPGLGRYVQSDPIGLLGGTNNYSYVGSHPTRGVDPTGLLEHFMLELNSEPVSSLECGCRDSYPAFSGNPPYRNDPNSTTQAGIGAAPTGWYYIVDRPQGGIGGRVMSLVTGKYEWFALYRDDGTPGDDTVEKGVMRREIRLHPKGSRGNSFGCVTLNKQADYDRLRKLLLRTKTGIISGTNIKYYGTILIYRPTIGEPW